MLFSYFDHANFQLFFSTILFAFECCANTITVQQPYQKCHRTADREGVQSRLAPEIQRHQKAKRRKPLE